MRAALPTPCATTTPGSCGSRRCETWLLGGSSSCTLLLQCVGRSGASHPRCGGGSCHQPARTRTGGGGGGCARCVASGVPGHHASPPTPAPNTERRTHQATTSHTRRRTQARVRRWHRSRGHTTTARVTGTPRAPHTAGRGHDAASMRPATYSWDRRDGLTLVAARWWTLHEAGRGHRRFETQATSAVTVTQRSTARHRGGNAASLVTSSQGGAWQAPDVTDASGSRRLSRRRRLEHGR